MITFIVYAWYIHVCVMAHIWREVTGQLVGVDTLLQPHGP